MRKLFFSLFLLLLAIGLFFEFSFRKTTTLEGVMNFCLYKDAVSPCSYITTGDGRRYLLSEGSLLKFERDVGELAGWKMILVGKISRQKFSVIGFGELNRFQVEEAKLVQYIK